MNLSKTSLKWFINPIFTVIPISFGWITSVISVIIKIPKTNADGDMKSS